MRQNDSRELMIHERLHSEGLRLGNKEIFVNQ